MIMCKKNIHKFGRAYDDMRTYPTIHLLHLIFTQCAPCLQGCPVALGAKTSRRFDKSHSGRIHAVAQTGRFWAVIENMTQMSITAAADNFCPF